MLMPTMPAVISSSVVLADVVLAHVADGEQRHYRAQAQAAPGHEDAQRGQLNGRRAVGTRRHVHHRVARLQQFDHIPAQGQREDGDKAGQACCEARATMYTTSEPASSTPIEDNVYHAPVIPLRARGGPQAATAVSALTSKCRPSLPRNGWGGVAGGYLAASRISMISTPTATAACVAHRRSAAFAGPGRSCPPCVPGCRWHEAHLVPVTTSTHAPSAENTLPVRDQTMLDTQMATRLRHDPRGLTDPRVRPWQPDGAGRVLHADGGALGVKSAPVTRVPRAARPAAGPSAMGRRGLLSHTASTAEPSSTAAASRRP